MVAWKVELSLERLQKRFRGCRLIFDLAGVRSFEYFGIAILANNIRGQKSHFQAISLIGLQPSTESVFKSFGLTCATVA